MFEDPFETEEWREGDAAENVIKFVLKLLLGLAVIRVLVSLIP
jgi:hypothetical protein